MSLFGGTYKGSLLSDDGSQHAREGYRPGRLVPTAHMAFAHWTERVEAQPDLVSARELAGLQEQQLAALASEFEASPCRKRTDKLRFAFPAAAGTAALGVVFALCAGVSGWQAPGLSPFTFSAVAMFGAAFVSVSAGALAAFRLVTTEQAYGKLGLFVEVLDEQHPWLYKTYLLMRNSAAHAYREKVLRERGPLRGMDYVMMREIASRHEDMELTQTARFVALSVQGERGAEVIAAPALAVTPSSEPCVIEHPGADAAQPLALEGAPAAGPEQAGATGAGSAQDAA